MASPKYRRSRLLLSFAAALVLFAIRDTAADALSVSLSSELRKLGPAAIRLQGDRTYDFSGRVLRCQPDQGVGIVAESRGLLSVTNVTIDGCTIGIIATGSAVRLEHVTVQNTTGVCMLLGGEGSIAVSNVATGCTYGMAVLSNGNRITQNQFNDNIADGLLVTGDENLIEGNEALRNGGVGIHVVRMVPMVGDDQFISLIQDRAVSNVIKGNTALSNNVDLEEFGACSDPGLFNDWSDNIFKTGRPDCVH
jgi:parallel beta helix pectate lyase-like protein